MQKTLSRAEWDGLIGEEIMKSKWVDIDQERINVFAEATDDHQFIHTDPEKAAKTPFGGTIAHGFLTLSLIAPLGAECSPEPDNCAMTLNYGFDKVRFLTPVKAGSKVRVCGKLVSVEDKKADQLLVKYAVTMEIEGSKTPAYMAEQLMLFILK